MQTPRNKETHQNKLKETIIQSAYKGRKPFEVNDDPAMPAIVRQRNSELKTTAAEKPNTGSYALDLTPSKLSRP